MREGANVGISRAGDDATVDSRCAMQSLKVAAIECKGSTGIGCRIGKDLSVTPSAPTLFLNCDYVVAQYAENSDHALVEVLVRVEPDHSSLPFRVLPNCFIDLFPMR